MNLQDLTQLDKIEQNTRLTALAVKDVLTMEEAALYMGISTSELYKKTACRSIPHFKPGGKLVYLKRKDVEGYMMQNRISTNEELDEQAQKKASRKCRF